MEFEWPLIGWTVAFQWSAGLMLMYHLFLYYPLFTKKAMPPDHFKQVPIMACLIAIVGLIFSFVHLENPIKAFRVLHDLGSSWFSRQFLLTVIYFVFILLVLVGHYIWKDYKRRIRWMLNLLNITGILLIYGMAMVHCTPNQTAWYNLFTPINFYLSMLLLGSSTILLFQLRSGSMASQITLSVLFITIATIFLALIPVQMAYLSKTQETTQFSLNILLNDNTVLFYIKICLLLVSLLAGIWTRESIHSDSTRNRTLVIPASIAMISGVGFVIIDRILFYLQAL